MLQINTTDKLLPNYAETALHRQEAFISQGREEKEELSQLDPDQPSGNWRIRTGQERTACWTGLDLTTWQREEEGEEEIKREKKSQEWQERELLRTILFKLSCPFLLNKY